jgi:3-hydroxyisobutyrate dehydrogenase
MANAGGASERPRVGFIGLGVMGGPMALNVLKAGYPLTVHNRSPQKMEPLVAEGAKAAASPREVVDQVDVLLTCVGFPADVQRVYLGPDGAVEGARAGQLFCDLSTVDQQTHLQIAERLGGREVGYLDAPISGGVAGARDAKLTIMVGGSPEDFARVRPLLDVMGSNVHHVGPVGAGAVVKLINQMMNALNSLGAAEGLVLGTKAGIDPAVLHEILRTSSGSSSSLDRLATAAFKRDFAPGFTLDLMHKDVSLAVDLARAQGVRFLAGALTEQLLQEGRAAGLGDQAFTAVITAQERLAGVEVKPTS